MEIYYENTDITDMVQVRKCIVHDTAGKRCDSISIEFENAAGWRRWGPKEDDRIIVVQSGYSSGQMYVNTVQEEEGHYRLFATALPCKARQKGCYAYINKTLEEVMRHCAAVSNMEYQIFGLDPNTVIPYMERDHEGCAAFLSRFLMLEGAVLKCVNGKYTAIGLEYAQDIANYQAIEVSLKQKGMQYSRNGNGIKKLTVSTPYAQASAEDTAASKDWLSCTKYLPARNNIQAGRWARSLLLSANRMCETVYLQERFNSSRTAMTRLDISGYTDAAGEWLIEDVEHDLKDLRTSISMRRCIRTIR